MSHSSIEASDLRRHAIRAIEAHMQTGEIRLLSHCPSTDLRWYALPLFRMPILRVPPDTHDGERPHIRTLRRSLEPHLTKDGFVVGELQLLSLARLPHYRDQHVRLHLPLSLPNHAAWTTIPAASDCTLVLGHTGQAGTLNCGPLGIEFTPTSPPCATETHRPDQMVLDCVVEHASTHRLSLRPLTINQQDQGYLSLSAIEDTLHAFYRPCSNY